jgi:putative ABC transport system substrate-binding protein
MSPSPVLLLVVALAIVAGPLAEAQSPGKIYRLGMLSPAAPPASSHRGGMTLIPVALRELGYVEGQNLVVERRFAEGKLDRLPALARELVLLRVDVIQATSASGIQAAKEATTTIPIVMGFGVDPVERGFVASLARPGGNITGVTVDAGIALAGKRLELIKEMVPRAKRIAVLTTEESSGWAQVREAEKAAAALGVTLVVVEVRGQDYERAFATMKAERASGLFIVSSALLNNDRKRIIELATKHRLPAIYWWRHHVEEEGGLMAYGPDDFALYRRVAAHIDRIFKGANPADLPVEQPTKFELVVNAKTAKVLGLTIPPLILIRADRVIE